VQPVDLEPPLLKEEEQAGAHPARREHQLERRHPLHCAEVGGIDLGGLDEVDAQKVDVADLELE
jgi:hypothetical protein